MCVYLSPQVSRILYSFSTAFRRSSRLADIRDTALSTPPDSDLYTFTVTLDIKEDDGKGNYRYLKHTQVLWKPPIWLHEMTRCLAQFIDTHDKIAVR